MPNGSIDAFLIRDRFNMEWVYDDDNGADQDTWWWYAISVRVDPNEIIADDGEGHLWSVPFTTDGTDQVTFATPVRVAQTFVPVAVGDGAAASAIVGRRRQQVLASFDRPTKPDPGTREVPSQYRTPAASERHDPEEDQTMPIDLDALRTRLGLSEDATEEQINEALTADPPETFTPEQVAEQVAAAQATAREEARQQASAAATDDTVRFDRATAEQLQADARAGREAREQQIAGHRDRLVAAAVDDGRVPPARREHWRRALDADPEGTEATLASLERGLIPVTERGVAAAGPDDANPAGTVENLDFLFPQLQAQEG